eukprot:gene35330-43563_t
MYAIRKVAVQSARSVARTGVKAPFVTRNFSSVIEKKEHADEARYIREVEARRKAEIRANMERILALEDSHDEKTHLVELLEKKEETGFLAKFGLNDWKYAVPVGAMLLVPAISNQILVLDAEFQLSCCFFLFVSAAATNLGPMLASGFQASRTEIQTKLEAVDDAIKEQLVDAIAANTAAITAETDITEFFHLKDNLRLAQADALTNQEAHKYRDAVVKKLDSLYALEEAANNAIRARVISKVQSDVLNTFKTDRKAKDNALNQAIAVLAGGANAKLGKDVVGELFASSLKSYQEDYAKQPAGSDPILKKLQEDMADVAKAPEISSKGGNVYITHPY